MKDAGWGGTLMPVAQVCFALGFAVLLKNRGMMLRFAFVPPDRHEHRGCCLACWCLLFQPASRRLLGGFCCHMLGSGSVFQHRSQQTWFVLTEE
jgi:hypothetical protein